MRISNAGTHGRREITEVETNGDALAAGKRAVVELNITSDCGIGFGDQHTDCPCLVDDLPIAACTCRTILIVKIRPGPGGLFLDPGPRVLRADLN